MRAHAGLPDTLSQFSKHSDDNTAPVGGTEDTRSNKYGGGFSMAASKPK